MMKPKEYLRSIGIETGGRGRMPKDHVALIQKAVNEGMAIEGYSRTGAANDEGTREVVRVATNGEKKIADIGAPTRDEMALIAKVNGTTVGMRSVCRCGNSLTYCYCDTPMMWVDSDTLAVVSFFPRPANAPRPNRWW